MAVTLEELMQGFTPEQRAQVEARAAELIAEEMAKVSRKLRRERASKEGK